MPKWSESQLAAINHVGKNIVVSASAGSGKTAVLTARMVKRITEDKIPVHQLLAMTFTDAAASEMKNRLYSGLNDIINTTDDNELKQYCINQCAMLGNALICTIHSFCLTVIKENSYIINLPSNQVEHIFSDEEMKVLHNDAMTLTLSSMMNQDKKIFNDVVCYFDNRIDSFDNLKSTILNIAKCALNQSDADLFFNNILITSKQPDKLYELNPLIAYYLFIRFEIEINMIKENIDEAIKLTSFMELEDEVVANLKTRLNHVEHILSAIVERNYREFIRRLHSLCEVKPLNTKNKECKEINEYNKKVNKALQDLASQYFEEEILAYDQRDLFYIVLFLVDSAKLYLKNLEYLKERNHGIDFSDMEHLAYKILCANNYEISQKYKLRFQEILVDEFQDTNEFQNQMIELISRGNNIFRVGDIKQSIYRFRGAKPNIMSELMKIEDEQNELIVLHHNYRSNKSIVEFNNQLFNELMNVEILNNEFTKNDFAEPGLTSQDDQYTLPVEFLKIQNAEEGSDEDDVKKVHANARILANKILDMKNTTQFNKWSDYCVLVRSHATKNDIRYIFESLNIPYTTTVNTGLYNSYAVRICLSYLRLLVDKNNNIECVSVLSGLYQCNDELLATMHLARNKDSYFRVATTLLDNFKTHYENIKSTLYRNGIASAVNEILKINSFYWVHLNNQERANIDLFIQRINKFEETNSNLSVFLNLVESSLDVKSNTAVSASKSDNVVQITTIHQSKGLQFPVVFFWSSSKTVIMDEKEFCLVDESLGIGFNHISMPYRYKRPTLNLLAIKTKNMLEEFSENVRLYYVALTRAQKVGFIIDSFDIDTVLKPLTLSSFFEKKGSTHLICAVMDRLHSLAYKDSYVDEDYTSSFTNDKPSHEEFTLMRYEYQIDDVKQAIATPSSQKEFPLRPLTYNKANNTIHGTLVHKMIEQLPLCPWREELIVKQFPNISSYDLHILKQLGNNSFFIEINQGKVTKEFAYAIKENNEITHGFIDFLSILEQRIIIVDYKTDKVNSLDELKERYSSQMSTYINNISFIYPDKLVECYIYSFTLHEFTRVY